MKKGAAFLTALTFLWPLMGSAEEGRYYSESFARLSFIKGDVYVERANELGTEEGVVNLALVEGDKLISRAGRAEVHFGKRNYLRLDSSTEVEFSVMPREGDNRVRLHLFAGAIYLRISYLREEKTFEVHTPDASFYVLEEGLYRVDMKTNGETVISVIQGSIEAAGETGSKLLRSRESLIASGGHLGTQRAFSFRQDDFDFWNQDRDSLLRQDVSRRYLPVELEDYEGELNSHGYWVYERPYGYVWVPYVIYAGWRPYYYGRWVWYPVCGWTWVSYEPWGWCVYHYGRWHWRLGLGWYWIPTCYWGPAWVHWYWGYDYIGWCPLSWYNRPVVIVNNYFYDRYHHSYYPAHSRALTVVHRTQLQSPDVSRVALSHVEASRLGQITLQARQPDIKPTISLASLASPSEKHTLRPPLSRPAAEGLIPSGTAIRPSFRSATGLSTEKSRLTTPSGRVEPGLKSTEKRELTRGSWGGPSSVSKDASLLPQSFRSPRDSVFSVPRRTKSDSKATAKSSDPSARRGVASNSASPSISSPFTPSRERRSSLSGELPKASAPDHVFSRAMPSSPRVAFGKRSQDGGSRSFSPSSLSAPKSIFSGPRSSSSSALISAPHTTPKFLPSFSAAPQRSFAPSRSASYPGTSHRAPGRVVRKNN